MKNKLLLPLLALLILGALFLWKMSGGTVEEPHDATGGLAPDAVNAAISNSNQALLPEVSSASEVGASRAAVAPVEREVHAELEPSAPPPSNAIWVKGRVLYPDRMPNDMGGLKVTARGRRFGDLDSRREHTVDVARDGTFRVALSKETSKGWLEAEGRYLYMEDKLQVDAKNLPEEVVLETKLGGVVTGIALPPPGQKWTEAALKGAVVRINSWSSGQSVGRSSPIDARGHFELLALPPNNSYSLRFEFPLWCDLMENSVTVKSGEITTHDVQIEMGSVIRGRVVNQTDVGRGGVAVELNGTPADGSWMHDNLMTEADGSFVFRGVKEADVTLKAVMGDHLPVEEPLGLVRSGSQREGVVLRIVEGNSIEGVVRWPDGTPVANASVSVSQDRDVTGLMFNFSNAVSEKSNADGTFRVAGLESSVCEVRAAAKSFRPEDLAKAQDRAEDGRDHKLRARGPLYKVRVSDVQPGTTGLVLVLSEGDSLSGRVTDDQGKGLTAFLITAEPLEGPGSEFSDEDAIRRVVTSLDGRFTIDGLQDGQWEVRAKAKGHEISPKVLITSPGAAEVELVAQRFAELKGVVRNPSGTGVSGARVFVEQLDVGEEFKLEQIARTWGEEATTNQDGEFTARDLAPGRCRVSASAQEFGSSQGVLVNLAPGSNADGVVLQLRRPASIHGQLHASVGDIGGRNIQVRAEMGGNFWKEAKTNASGKFELEGLDAGTYRLTLQDDDNNNFFGGFESPSASRTVAEVVQVAQGQDVHIILGGPPANPTTVSGTVRSGTKGVAGAVVHCQSNTERELDNDSTKTDANGRYSLTVRSSGVYNFRIGNPSTGMADYSRELSAGANDGVDFALPTGTISGFVRGLDGEPMKGCDLTLFLQEPVEGSDGGGHRRALTTDDNGLYEFEFLAAGKYYVRVHDRNTRGWRRSNSKQPGTQLREGLVLAEGASIEGVNFDLQVQGEIEGQVTGSNGLAVQGARIVVTSLSGIRAHEWRGVNTDAGGNFTQNGLGPGKYLIKATLNDQSSREVEVRVDAGATSEVFLSL